MDSNPTNRSEENGDAPRHTLIGKCVMKTLTHPLDYARFLAQVCYDKIFNFMVVCNY